jgi:O-methyltransferase
MKIFINQLLAKFGYVIEKKTQTMPVEAHVNDIKTFNYVKKFTMTSNLRIWALISTTRYIIENKVEGDIVECGVWRGGSAMAISRTLIEMGELKKIIYLYDTFSGMTEPTNHDVEEESGVAALDLLTQTAKADGNNIWCVASRDEVFMNMKNTGYPMENIKLIMGDVKTSLLQNFPEKISLLRLDTDWYESTKVELEVLYPRLVKGGVCIIDDYGHWAGARKAVDEYFRENNLKPLFHVIDATGRIFIKN